MLITAGIWRRLMFKTTFIAVSGSVGKTTAKDAIALVLGQHFRTHKTRGSANHYDGLTRSLLSVRPWHRYAVIEIGLDRPGQMKWFALATNPDIAVWVNVARTHMQSFKTLETISAEKSLLVESLGEGGLAVLNSDNPFIAAYSPPERVRTIRYGVGEPMDCRASEASSKWPERLSFLVRLAKEEGRISTRLVGTHWVSSVLPAIAIAREAGLSVKEASFALRGLEPMAQRLSPATTPQGVTFLRDEWNASIDTLRVALDVLRDAEAKRKILIFSGMSGATENDKRRNRRVGQSAAEICDLAVFVGDRNQHCVAGALHAGMPPDRVHGFYDLESAVVFLRAALREGDLVLLRGLMYDRMSRAYLAMLGEVNCWIPTCKKKNSCDVCPELKAKVPNDSPLVQISSERRNNNP